MVLSAVFTMGMANITPTIKTAMIAEIIIKRRKRCLEVGVTGVVAGDGEFVWGEGIPTADGAAGGGEVAALFVLIPPQVEGERHPLTIGA
jgi:hypothetical protein